MLVHFMLLATAGAATWVCIEGIRRLAMRAHLVDLPNARSSHTVPTPRVGGVAICGVVSAAAWMLYPEPSVRTAVLLGLGLGGLSLVDDLRGLPAVMRLVVHLLVAGAAVWTLGPVLRLDVAGHPIALSAWLAWGGPILWIAGFINAFNFMDGSDGIAGTQALVATLGWLALVPSDTSLAQLVALAAASLIGFLAHNWSPARIFMGDVGSAYLGFLLACLPLISPTPERLLLPGMILVWPFVFDTAFTLAVRARRGANVLRAHREHLYQRLLRSGYTHAGVARLYGGWAAVSAVAAVLVARTSQPAVVVVACLVCASSAAAAVIVVRRVERRAGARAEECDAQ